MLVLSRRTGEELKIGGGITVRVVQVKGNCVRLGIEAPPEVSVDRAEVAERKQLEQAAAGEVVTAGDDHATNPKTPERQKGESQGGPLRGRVAPSAA